MDHALVLAGGLGERLWPLSRKQTKTKESVNIASYTMLELTVKRLQSWVPKERIWIVSSREIPTYGCHLIKEPLRKNTAAAVAWGAETVYNLDKEAFIGVFPVDHLISPWEKVIEAISLVKEKGALTALGIKSDAPSKQYGYIKPYPSNSAVSPVESFIEKPDHPEKLLQEGFLINSGIYLGPARKFLAEIGRFLPYHLAAVRQRDKQLFAKLRSVSLDKGVMEHTDRLYCVPLQVKWEDIGSWSKYLKHAGEKGQFVKYNSDNSLVYAEEGLVVLSGVKDVVVVVKDGIVLVTSSEEEKNMSLVLEEVRKKYPGQA